MFDGIIGNDEIKQELIKSVNLNKISHSYLFIGNEGIGKKLIAKEFAKMILNNDHKRNIDLSNIPDFEEISPDGSSVKIEQIRKLQKKVLEAPISSTKKVYIIDDADLMTLEAQNCLLKTLEEPPEFVIIILIGNMESKFLNTIKSRCTIIKFKALKDDEIKQYAKQKYNLDIPDNLLQFFEGSIGKTENFEEKKDVFYLVSQIIENIENMDFIDYLKNSEEIYNHQNEKFEILDNMNVAFFKKIKEDFRYANCINIIEDTKKRLIANGNFNMCIDNMLFKLWEELH